MYEYFRLASIYKGVTFDLMDPFPKDQNYSSVTIAQGLSLLLTSTHLNSNNTSPYLSLPGSFQANLSRPTYSQVLRITLPAVIQACLKPPTVRLSLVLNT